MTSSCITWDKETGNEGGGFGVIIQPNIKLYLYIAFHLVIGKVAHIFYSK